MTVFIFVIYNTSANNLIRDIRSRHSLKLQHTSRKFTNSLYWEHETNSYITKKNCMSKKYKLPRRRLEIIRRRIIYLLFRILDCHVSPFFIIMRSCDILGTCTVHLQKIMRILLRVWIAWLVRWKTQYEHQSLKQNNILWFQFSSQPYFLCSNGFFLGVVRSYYFVVCFMM
jgi:hypothetical protein